MPCIDANKQFEKRSIISATGEYVCGDYPGLTDPFYKFCRFASAGLGFGVSLMMMFASSTDIIMMITTNFDWLYKNYNILIYFISQLVMTDTGTDPDKFQSYVSLVIFINIILLADGLFVVPRTHRWHVTFRVGILLVASMFMHLHLWNEWIISGWKKNYPDLDVPQNAYKRSLYPVGFGQFAAPAIRLNAAASLNLIIFLFHHMRRICVMKDKPVTVGCSFRVMDLDNPRISQTQKFCGREWEGVFGRNPVEEETGTARASRVRRTLRAFQDAFGDDDFTRRTEDTDANDKD